jgi:hypothetical protein
VINNAERPDALGQPFEDSPGELHKAMEQVFSALMEGGRERADAARALLAMEPFNQFPELAAAFLEEAARKTSA